jgi:hypothetical protein
MVYRLLSSGRAAERITDEYARPQTAHGGATGAYASNLLERIQAVSGEGWWAFSPFADLVRIRVEVQSGTQSQKGSGSMKETRKITRPAVAIRPATNRLIEQISVDLGISKSEVVTRCVDAYVQWRLDDPDMRRKEVRPSEGA